MIPLLKEENGFEIVPNQEPDALKAFYFRV